MNEKNALIVYFSGTGGTKRIAETFEKDLNNNKFNVVLQSLDKFENYSTKAEYLEYLKKVDLLLILYPVYAFDAPKIVYDWIEELPTGVNIHTMIISVSGGGEIWPNTSCRVKPIKNLEEKGYYVFYEDMMVMPSNCIIKTNDHLSMHLLRAMPLKVEKVVDDVINEKNCRTNYKISTSLILLLSKIEKKYGRTFSSSLKVKESCTSCALCVTNCPKNNIIFKERKPVFGDKCEICLRCIYRCPSKAIYTSRFKNFLINEGYNLENIEEKMKDKKLLPIEKCCKGLLWLGVKKYLQEISY